MVHGLGEHTGRYERVAGQLTRWGFCHAPTRLRGMRLQRGINASMAPQKPLSLVLLGHSLGGLVAGRFVPLKIRPVEALVMSSRALDVGLGVFKSCFMQHSDQCLQQVA